MQKYKLRFYLLIHFQLMKFCMFDSEIKHFCIFRETSPKININIYIYVWKCSIVLRRGFSIWWAVLVLSISGNFCWFWLVYCDRNYDGNYSHINREHVSVIRIEVISLSIKLYLFLDICMRWIWLVIYLFILIGDINGIFLVCITLI